VLSDAMRGERTLFAREDYVEEAWRIVDPAVKGHTAPHEYDPGTWGPAEGTRIMPPGGWQDPIAESGAGIAGGLEAHVHG
jgi:glucose-6-phosphate 1-dehydrogenase